MYKSVELFPEPRNKILPMLENVQDEPEMSEFESAFLCGLLRMKRPKKIVEVGIAGGGHNLCDFAVYGYVGDKIRYVFGRLRGEVLPRCLAAERVSY